MERAAKEGELDKLNEVCFLCILVLLSLCVCSL